MSIDYILIFLAGLGGGFLAGLLGIGGGVIYILILPLALREVGVTEQEIAQHVIANSIFGTMAASLFASIALIRNKDFYWRDVLVVGISGVVLSYLLLFFFVNTPYYSERTFNIAVIIFLVLILFTSFNKTEHQLFFKEPVSNKKAWYIFTGGTAGAMAALSGLGGGTVVVPLLKSGLHMDIKRAKSISLGVILITSALMTVFNMLDKPTQPFEGSSLGYIVFPVALPLSIGVVLSSPLGVKVSNKISSRTISYIFAGFLLLVIVRKAIALIQSF